MRSAVLVSIDGFSLAVRKPLEGCPFLSELLSTHEAACVRELEPTYPTLTMSCHASMVTGVHPDRHGVGANTRFSPADVPYWLDGQSRQWLFHASAIRTPTLWQKAREAGLTVAMLRWPLSLGAEAQFVVPEVFDPGEATDHDWLDEWVTRVATRILGARPIPDLTLIHLASVDHFAHERGRGSAEARRARRRTDDRIRRIHAAVGDRADIWVVGDHGTRDFERRIHLNALLAEAGWLEVREGRIVGWKAVAHNNCAMTYVHLRDESSERDRRALGHLLKAHSEGLYLVREEAEMRDLRTWVEAPFAIESLPGFSMGQNLEGPLVTCLEHVRGDHGYTPGDPEMSTALIAFGRGIAAGAFCEKASVCDVGPTVADQLELSLGEVDGKALSLRALL